MTLKIKIFLFKALIFSNEHAYERHTQTVNNQHNLVCL